jgi:hypothetical protein
MRGWPPITEPELLERLALDEEEFVAFTMRLWRALPEREYEPELFKWALGYPWKRPPGSYILRNKDVRLLAELEEGQRQPTVAAHTEGRHPILAFGANASPSSLARKFAHFPDEEDRTVLVLAGSLLDFDVGPAPTVAPTGYMPATLFESPGTAVRAAVIWTTPAQLTQLTWSEIPYHLARLEDAEFLMEEADVEVDQIFAYVHRLGSFCIDGAPVALAAIPASDRTAIALTQEELLDLVARLALRPSARAEDVVRAIYADTAGTLERLRETVWPSSQQLTAAWTPLPKTPC